MKTKIPKRFINCTFNGRVHLYPELLQAFAKANHKLYLAGLRVNELQKKVKDYELRS